VKIRMLKSGEVVEVNAEYGARLIEQGRAVLHVCPEQPAQAEEKAEAKPAAETKAEKTKARKSGDA